MAVVYVRSLQDGDESRIEVRKEFWRGFSEAAYIIRILLALTVIPVVLRPLACSKGGDTGEELTAQKYRRDSTKRVIREREQNSILGVL